MPEITKNIIYDKHISLYVASACPSGQFGEFCEKQCHCADHSELCDDVTGACTSGCHTDFTGADCQTRESVLVE